MPERPLAGKVVVLTGATGRLGGALGHALGEAGATIVATSRDPAKARAASDDLAKAGFSASSLELDVTDEASVDAAFRAIAERHGRVDALVNNAGVATKLSIDAMTSAEWARVMDVNVRGAFLCARAAAREMARARAGSIVNVSSIYGSVSPDPRIYGATGRNSSVVYGASKAALLQMTRYLAVHWAEQGIRVNAVSPGGIEAGQEPAFRDAYASRVPLRRMAKREEVGGAVVFLLSDAASYVTGQDIAIDGGWTAW